MAIFYLDNDNGNDAITNTPLGWWSVVVSSPTGNSPLADETMTQGNASAKLTIAASTWTGTPTLYFYGKTGTFSSGTVNFSGGGSGTIAGDLTYCAWQTFTNGATAARIAPDDIIRIAKSPAPRSIGNGTWTGTSVVGGGMPATIGSPITSTIAPVGVFVGSPADTYGWTLGAGWSAGNAVITHTNGGGTNPVSPTTPITVVIGQTYYVNYTMTRTTGSLTVSIGGASGTTRSVAGTYTETIVATTTDNLAFTPSNDYAGDLSAIAVWSTQPYSATPIVVRQTHHGYSTGDVIYINGQSNCPSANGAWVITVLDSNHYSLTGSAYYHGTGVAAGSSQKINSKVVKLATAQTATVSRCEMAGTNSTVGANMVTNGTFDSGSTGWTVGSWTYGSSKMSHTNGGGTTALQPSTALTIVAGTSYYVIYDIVSWTSGTSITAAIGGTNGTARSGVGHYAEVITASTTGNLTITPTTDVVASIDNIYVFPLDASSNGLYANWVGSSGVNATSYSSYSKEGSSSIELTGTTAITYAANTLYAFRTLSTTGIDYSSYSKLSFWLYSSKATSANQWIIALCSDPYGTTIVDTFAIPALPGPSSFTPLTLSRVGGGTLGSSIQSVAIYSGSAAPTFTATDYFLIDNILACTDSGLNLQSLISKNSAEKDGTEAWYGIQSINNQVVVLDNSRSTYASAGRGYSGATETVTTYIRETTKTAMAASGGVPVNTIQDSGTLGHNIQFQGGYDTRTNMQTGETFFDGLNGYGYGIYASSINYITLSYLNGVRYYNALYITSGTGYNVYMNNCNNCYNDNIYLSGITNSIFTLANVNNGDSRGLDIYSCLRNTFNIGTASNNLNYGVYLSSSNANVLSGTLYLNNNTSANLYPSNCYDLTIGPIGGLNYSSAHGLYTYISGNLICNSITANYNANYGLNFSDTDSLNNRIYSYTSTGNGSGGINVAGGPNYIANALCSESTPVNGPTTTLRNYRLHCQKYGQIVNNHYIFTDYGTINSVSDANRHTLSGIAWKLSPTNAARTYWYPLKLSIAKVAVSANKQVTISAWVKKTDATGIGAQLFLQGNQIAGVPNDITALSPNDTNYNQLTLTPFTPTENGVVEVECWAWCISSTTASVYVDDVTVIQN